MYDPNLKAFEDMLAARYALGVADALEIEVAEARLVTDAAFAMRVGAYDEVFSELNQDMANITPPSHVWARIEKSVDDIEKSPHTKTVRSSEHHWEPFAPGINRKVLHVDTAQAAQIILYQVAPGTEFGVHGHLIPEECFVLEGEIEVDGVTVHAGDIHIAFAKTRHNMLTSRTGALLYVRADIQMQS